MLTSSTEMSPESQTPSGFFCSSRLPRRPYRFKVIRAVTGDEITVHPCSSNEICEDTSVECLIPIVAEKLDLPPEYVEITVGQTVVNLARRGSGSTHGRTLLKDFVALNEEYVVLQATKRPQPEFFGRVSEGMCESNVVRIEGKMLSEDAFPELAIKLNQSFGDVSLGEHKNDPRRWAITSQRGCFNIHNVFRKKKTGHAMESPGFVCKV